MTSSASQSTSCASPTVQDTDDARQTLATDKIGTDGAWRNFRVHLAASMVFIFGITAICLSHAKDSYTFQMWSLAIGIVALVIGWMMLMTCCFSAESISSKYRALAQPRIDAATATMAAIPLPTQKEQS